jgi:hypothetical protein
MQQRSMPIPFGIVGTASDGRILHVQWHSVAAAVATAEINRIGQTILGFLRAFTKKCHSYFLCFKAITTFKRDAQFLLEELAPF